MISLLYLYDFITILILSLLINYFIINIVKLGVLGNPLKNKLNILLKSKLYLFSIVTFFLCFALSFLLKNYTNMNNIFLSYLSDYNIIIFSSIISFLTFSFILDGFKLSELKVIRILQIILVITLLIGLFSLLNIGVVYASDGSEINVVIVLADAIKNKEVSIGADIIVRKEEAQIIGESTKAAASQIGLGASIGGVAAATSKAIKTNSIPVTSKLALVAAGAIGEGLGSVGASSLLKITANTYNKDNSQKLGGEGGTQSWISDINSGPACPYEADWISHLFTDNPAEVALYSIYGLNLLSLLLIILLSLFLLSKYLSDIELELTVIDKLIPQPYNITVKKIILKILKIYSKTSNLNIILALIILLFCTLTSNIFLMVFIKNFAQICKVFLNL